MNKNLHNTIKFTEKLLDNWLPIKIQYDNTPGIALCIAHKGVPVYRKAFGVSDIDKKTPMRIDSLFRVASISKMFTAVAIMQLQEQGKIKLDDKISDYLLYFKKDKKIKNITIRQLLSHTSGLFRDGNTRQWINGEFPKSLEHIDFSESVTFESGVNFKYSNYGYAILGSLIEKISECTYSEYQKKYIIEPLGLENTFSDLPISTPERLASGYQRKIPNVDIRKKELCMNTNIYAPATGFISDLGDMATFLSSVNPNNKNSLLSHESRKQMLSIQSIVDKNTMYALGFILKKISKYETYGHSGGFIGYSTNSVSSIKDNLQIVVMTNTVSDTAHNVSNAIMQLIFGSAIKNLKFKTNDPYSATYRNRWEDITIISLGDDLIQFSTSTSNPKSNWIILKKHKTGIYKNMDKDGFGFSGECYYFGKIANNKFQEINCGGMTWKRII